MRYFRIPNRVAARRFGQALLQRYRLLHSMRKAVHDLVETGSIHAVLSGYRLLMQKCDVMGDLDKDEAAHCDSICLAILENLGLEVTPEYKVIKARNPKLMLLDSVSTNMQLQSSGGPGRIDLHVLSKRFCVVIEFKSVQVRFLNLTGNREERAENLGSLTIEQLLKLRFSKTERFRKGQMRTFIKDSGDQLRSYLQSPEVKRDCEGRTLRGFLVLILGSRQVLFQEMDAKGEWVMGAIKA